MHTKTAPLTQAYAALIAEAASRALPDAAQRTAVLGFTDAVGVMLAGARETAVQKLTQWTVEQGGAAQARMVSSAVRSNAAQAAQVNATAAHALDFDDFAFSNHPSAVLVPAIMAAADVQPCTGERLVRAYLVGYEVWADAFLREKDLYYDKGWHPTAVLGTLGAAAAASVVWGLDAATAGNALALASSAAGGVFENFGTMAKPYHGGRAAGVGVAAAGMARCGLAASPTAIEGRHGLLRAFSPMGNVDLERPAPDGHSWRAASLGLNIKKYPVVGAAQRGIDAALGLLEREDVPVSRIVKIVAHISLRHAAVMPYHLPQDALQAKFSLEFALACALVHRAVGFGELRDEVVRSAQMQRLMACVEIVTTEEFEPGWRDAAPFDQIFVHLDDGRVIESPTVRRARGHADTPLTPAEIGEKFLRCTEHAELERARAEKLLAQLQRLPHLPSSSLLDIPVVA